MNYYPFHIGDYISHTNHLTDAEDLAYRRLIDLYYQTEKPFEHNLSWLARKVKSTPDTVDLILNEFFEFENDHWHSKRADEEIAKYQAIKEGGRKGAEKRWHKVSDSPPINPPLATNNQEPITNTNIKTNTLAPKVAIPIGVSEEVWNDFVTLRKSKKASLTLTALKGISREADKANLSLQEALEMCCSRGWAGFKADWVKENQSTNKPDSKMKDFWLQIEGNK